MKLKDIRDDYYIFSGKLSEIVRNLSFAGIAVIWTLRLGGGLASGVNYEKSLLIPLFGFVLVLALDLLHYLWATLATGITNFKLWNAIRDDSAEVDFPKWINRVTEIIFLLKVLLCAATQALLLYGLYGVISK